MGVTRTKPEQGQIPVEDPIPNGDAERQTIQVPQPSFELLGRQVTCHRNPHQRRVTIAPSGNPSATSCAAFLVLSRLA